MTLWLLLRIESFILGDTLEDAQSKEQHAYVSSGRGWRNDSQ